MTMTMYAVIGSVLQDKEYIPCQLAGPYTDLEQAEEELAVRKAGPGPMKWEILRVGSKYIKKGGKPIEVCHLLAQFIAEQRTKLFKKDE
jgi:hypothetical protein